MRFRQPADREATLYHRSTSAATRDAEPAPGGAAPKAVRQERTGKAPAESTDSVVVMSDEVTGVGEAEGRAQSSAAAPDSQALLRFMADNLPAAVCYVDGAERYAFANRVHEEWFGVPARETRGKTMREVLGEDAYGTVAPQVRAALRGEGATVEASLTCRNGRTRGVRAHYVPHWDESRGRVAGFLAVLSESGPAESGETAEHGRLLDLAHSARLALIGEMAGMLTHELAQPLAAISNYSSAASFLLQQGRNDEVRDITQKLGLHARRALAIVQGLRRFLRKQSGEREAIEVRDLVQEVLRLVQWEADSRGVPVRFETAMTLPSVYGDRTLIEQVVLNLLRNALDAVRDRPARDAPIVVTVGTAEGMVEVAVQDRGPGLTPEAKARLFEPFFTTKQEGLGVGLAICRRIIEAHGGKLWSEDNPDGPGTTFRFTLPGA